MSKQGAAWHSCWGNAVGHVMRADGKHYSRNIWTEGETWTATRPYLMRPAPPIHAESSYKRRLESCLARYAPRNRKETLWRMDREHLEMFFRDLLRHGRIASRRNESGMLRPGIDWRRFPTLTGRRCPRTSFLFFAEFNALVAIWE